MKKTLEFYTKQQWRLPSCYQLFLFFTIYFYKLISFSTIVSVY
ncbi:hypothetical protein [Chryseobacterium sp.]|nr:hypothetical protein [Chryseobacterium sp.]